MAWMSVHEDVIGPKLRKLAKSSGCSKNEALGSLVALWLWGIKNAEPSGLLKCADEEDVAEVLSQGLSEGIGAVKLVKSMITSGWLDQRENSLYLHDWDEWQAMWYKYLASRKHDTERKRILRQKEKEQQKSVETSVQKPSESEKKEDVPKPPPPKGSKYSTGFEAFWEVYPRKIDKGNAYKKYEVRRKDGYSDEELLVAARRYAEECRAKHTEPEYIKHPKTFLSDATPFVDYLPKKKDAEPKDEHDIGEVYERWGGIRG